VTTESNERDVAFSGEDGLADLIVVNQWLTVTVRFDFDFWVVYLFRTGNLAALYDIDMLGTLTHF